MKDRTGEIGYGDDPRHAPERTLWVAVVERAMRDYCWYLSSSDLMRGFSWGMGRKHFPQPGQPEYQKLLRNYRHLRWFLFEKKAIPYNLTYIYNNFLEDSGGIQRVRRYCIRYHAEHLKSVENDPKLAEMLREIRAISGRDKIDDTIKVPELRPHRTCG